MFGVRVPGVASAVDIERERIARGLPADPAMAKFIDATPAEDFRKLSLGVRIGVTILGVVLVVAALVSRVGPIRWEPIALGVMFVAGFLLWGIWAPETRKQID